LRLDKIPDTFSPLLTKPPPSSFLFFVVVVVAVVVVVVVGGAVVSGTFRRVACQRRQVLHLASFLPGRYTNQSVAVAPDVALRDTRCADGPIDGRKSKRMCQVVKI